MNHDDFAFGAPEPLSTAEAAELANMSDWPKKMWMGPGQVVFNEHEGDITEHCIPVLVYPADQALAPGPATGKESLQVEIPAPVGWIPEHSLGYLSETGFCHAELSRIKHDDRVALYLAPPTEAQIRAQERERIHDLLIDAMQDDLENGVKWLNEHAAQKFFLDFPALNKVIREMGDE